MISINQIPRNTPIWKRFKELYPYAAKKIEDGPSAAEKADDISSWYLKLEMLQILGAFHDGWKRAEEQKL